MNARTSLLTAAMLSLGLAASAQDMQGSFGVSAGPGGVNMNWNVQDPNAQPAGAQVQVNTTASKHEEQTVDRPGEHYKISWDSAPGHRTQLKILAPEGIGVRVSDGGAVVLQDTVPATLDAAAGHFLRVELFSPQAVMFDKKIEAKAGMIASLWVNLGPPPAANVMVQMNMAPPPAQPQPVMVAAAPPPPASPCMASDDFSGIKGAVEGESFSAQKLSTLETALSDRRMCVAQVIDMLGAFDFGNDKIAALKMMAPRINDRGNNYKVYSAFDFDSEKDQAKKILK